MMDELERTESREHYDRILGKIVAVGTYLKRRKNLVLTQYASDGNLLTMEDLRQSLAESCDSLKLCKNPGGLLCRKWGSTAECR